MMYVRTSYTRNTKDVLKCEYMRQKIRFELSMNIFTYPVKWIGRARERRKKGPIQLWCLSNWLNKINEGWYLTHIMHAIAMTKTQQYSFALYWTNQYWKAIIKWAFIPNNEVVELSILYSRKPHKCRNIAAQHESINTNEPTNERKKAWRKKNSHLPLNPMLSMCFIPLLTQYFGFIFAFFMVSNDTFI